MMTANGDTARTFGDRYVLGDRITAGDTREVWQAHDDIVSRQVALKIFFGAPPADPAWRERFRHDASRLVALSHPGIAKVYDHDESEEEAWLAMAFVAGRPLADLLADGSVDAATALDIVGQTAFAVQAAHDVGVAHGAIGPASIMIRPDGVVSLIGFAVASGARQADDLRALGELATHCLSGPAVSTSGLPPDVEDFMGWVTDAGHSTPRDAGEIGRTALALATSLRAGAPAAVVPPAPSPATDPIDAEPRYDDAERKQVRNRLIVLGTIVVVGGAALLRFVGESGGQVTVPSVVGLPVNQAQLQLTKDGLRSSPPQCVVGKDSGGTVVSQLPLVGASVKAGSTVVISYAQAVCP
jgi:serine/threonine protein kinase